MISIDFTIVYSQRNCSPSFEEIKKFESPSPKDALCQVWLKLVLTCWRKKMNILYFPYLPLGKLESPSPRDTLCQILMKLIQCVCRRRCLNVYNIISQILPGKKHDPAFEQNRNTPPKDALCLVWLKLVKWFRRRLFFYIFNIIYYFAITCISPRKRVWSYISTNFNPLQPWMLCAKFG